jgi:hypothetical protein
VRNSLDPTAFVKAHDMPGGPAPDRVREAIRKARVTLDDHDRRVSRSRESLDEASSELNGRVERLVSSI